AKFGQRLEVRRRVEVLGRQDGRRGAAREQRLQGPAWPQAAGVLEDDLAQRGAEGELLHPWVYDVTGDGVQDRRAACPVSIRAQGDDVVEVTEGLHVVQHRGLRVQPFDRRVVRRLKPGEAAAALQAFQEPGLLATDVRPGAAVDDHHQVESAAEDVLAEVP